MAGKLKATFHKEVFVGSVKTRLPFDLIIRDVEVKDLFKIREVFARGGMFDLLGGNFFLSELKIKKATLYIEKPAEAVSQDKIQDAVLSKEPAAASHKGETFGLPNITLKHLAISDSTLNFTDRSVADSVIKITFKDVNIEIENLELPVKSSQITCFELTGKIPWQNNGEEGKIWFQGWINFFKKDMRAELKIADIDGVYLYPYYSNWVDLEKSRIQKAKLNFFSEIIGLNNDVTADCHLELALIEFKPRPEDQPQEKAQRLATAVIDIFKAINEGKIVLDFKFKTKMDSPEFGLNKIIKTAVEDKISEARKSEPFNPEQILKMPAKIIRDTISTATDLTKSVINGTMSVGQEFKKAIETSFTREKESSKTPETQLNQTPQGNNSSGQ